MGWIQKEAGLAVARWRLDRIPDRVDSWSYTFRLEMFSEETHGARHPHLDGAEGEVEGVRYFLLRQLLDQRQGGRHPQFDGQGLKSLLEGNPEFGSQRRVGISRRRRFRHRRQGEVRFSQVINRQTDGDSPDPWWKGPTGVKRSRPRCTLQNVSTVNSSATAGLRTRPTIQR